MTYQSRDIPAKFHEIAYQVCLIWHFNKVVNIEPNLQLTKKWLLSHLPAEYKRAQREFLSTRSRQAKYKHPTESQANNFRAIEQQYKRRQKQKCWVASI